MQKKENPIYMTKIYLYFILILTLIPLFGSCGNSGGDANLQGGIDSIMQGIDVVTVSEDEIDEIIQSLPSPAEMSAMIKSFGSPFSKSYLSSPEQADDYDTNFKKALSLGILSADLGYLNVYEKTNESVNYLGTIRKISDDLNVGQFFDFHTLKRLATNSEDLDSLMFLSQRSFRQMDNYLRKNNRSNLSALVVTGVWVESLYLLTQIVKEDLQATELVDRIGEQKVILTMLNKVLQQYKAQDKNFTELAKNFQKLSDAYEGVSIETLQGEVKTVVIDGIEVTTTGDKSIVEISGEQLQTIITIVENIRNKLISL